jgi:hypothetical protein
MSMSNIEKRISRLEEQHGDHGIVIITLAPGEPMPPEGPGLTIVDDIARLVLRSEDMGEVE